MPVTDKTFPNPQYDPEYTGEPSFAIEDCLQLPLLFHDGGRWTGEKIDEWFRITGTTEASTKVMCDHLRRALGIHHIED